MSPSSGRDAPLFWQAADDCVVALETASPEVVARWRFIFGDRLIESATAPALTLRCTLVAELPPLPAAPPFFVDSRLGPPTTFGNLSVYRSKAGCLVLHFFEGGVAELALEGAGGLAVAIDVTASLLPTASFEDVIFTSLAPLLRRQGLFMLHAFAAARPDGSGGVLLVGPSGSGKTTTGLNLLLQGWRLLANDIVLLQEAAGEIRALPTPGVVSVRRKTFDLLPRLQQLTGGRPALDVALSGGVIRRWAAPSPVKNLFFPRIEPVEISHTSPEAKAVALARLMEESVDRWDAPLLPAHSSLLRRLVEQAAPSRLILGSDVDRLPGLLL